jgi:hypothetical protein
MLTIGYVTTLTSQFQEFQDSNLGVSRQNDIWVLALWPGTYNTIRVRWWLPPSPGCDESWESMFAHGLSVYQKCSNYALTNLLFGLCRSMWVIEFLVTLSSPHLKIPTRPSTPKMLRARECAPTPYPYVIFTFRLAIESIKEFEGASSYYNKLVIGSHNKPVNLTTCYPIITEIVSK